MPDGNIQMVLFREYPTDHSTFWLSKDHVASESWIINDSCVLIVEWPSKAYLRSLENKSPIALANAFRLKKNMKKFSPQDKIVRYCSLHVTFVRANSSCGEMVLITFLYYNAIQCRSVQLLFDRVEIDRVDVETGTVTVCSSRRGTATHMQYDIINSRKYLNSINYAFRRSRLEMEK